MPNGTSDIGLAVSVSGGTHDQNGGYHRYQSDEQIPPDVVIDRFIADGYDGAIRVTIQESVDNQTETIYGIDGNPHIVPRTVTHHLTVYRHGSHAAASYTHGDSATSRTWITHNPLPLTAAQAITPTWLDDPPLPADAMFPTDELHDVLREFVETGHRSTGVDWHAVPGEVR